MQMVNHGIIIGALFLIAGAFEARTGSRKLSDFGGLAKRLPLLATAFLIVSLAALGLPGLNSFAGEFLAFLGAFRANWWLRRAGDAGGDSGGVVHAALLPGYDVRPGS